MKYNHSVSKQHKEKLLETKFIYQRALSSGEPSFVVIVHYFINQKRVRFKDGSDHTNAAFSDQKANDIKRLHGIDPIIDWVDHEIDHLVHMVDHGLVEEVKEP